jgi:hypothetical protein
LGPPQWIAPHPGIESLILEYQSAYPHARRRLRDRFEPNRSLALRIAHLPVYLFDRTDRSDHAIGGWARTTGDGDELPNLTGALAVGAVDQ